MCKKKLFKSDKKLLHYEKNDTIFLQISPLGLEPSSLSQNPKNFPVNNAVKNIIT